MAKIDKFESDKAKVLGWMEKYCNGVRSARTRKDILPFVQLPDRYFRLIASELIDEGNVYSSASHGYWFAKLRTTDSFEISAMEHSILERIAKATSTIDGCHKRLKDIRAAGQGQQVFV